MRQLVIIFGFSSRVAPQTNKQFATPYYILYITYIALRYHSWTMGHEIKSVVGLIYMTVFLLLLFLFVPGEVLIISIGGD